MKTVRRKRSAARRPAARSRMCHRQRSSICCSSLLGDYGYRLCGRGNSTDVSQGDGRGLAVDFLVKDAMTLGTWDKRFATAIDSRLYHLYEVDDRRRYVAEIAHVLRPGGHLLLFSLADADKSTTSGVSRRELFDDLTEGREIELVELTKGKLNPEFLVLHPEQLPKGSADMWFSVIRRTADRDLKKGKPEADMSIDLLLAIH
jgi:SAM-dependent methyltransferase